MERLTRKFKGILWSALSHTKEGEITELSAIADAYEASIYDIYMQKTGPFRFQFRLSMFPDEYYSKPDEPFWNNISRESFNIEFLWPNALPLFGPGIVKSQRNDWLGVDFSTYETVFEADTYEKTAQAVRALAKDLAQNQLREGSPFDRLYVLYEDGHNENMMVRGRYREHMLFRPLDRFELEEFYTGAAPMAGGRGRGKGSRAPQSSRKRKSRASRHASKRSRKASSRRSRSSARGKKASRG